MSCAARYFDVLRTNDRDRFMHAAAQSQTVASVDARGTEAQLGVRQFAKNQVGGAEEGCHKACGGKAIQLLGPSGLEQTAVVHDADAIPEGKGLFLVVSYQ